MCRLVRLLGLLVVAFACLPVSGAAAATYTVSTAADSGLGSLRAAIEASNDPAVTDTISIGATGTIELDEKLPAILDDVTITGPGTGSLTIERTATTPFRVLEFVNADATVSDLTIAGGKDYAGAGILNSNGSLTLIRVAVTGNEAFLETGGSAFAGGAGILSTGPLTLREAVLSGNTAEARGGEHTVAAGGGVEATGPVTIERSTISGNSAQAYGEEQLESVAEGGGLLLTGGPLTIEESTISGNSVHAAEGPAATVARGGGLMADEDISLTGSTIALNSLEAEDSAGFRFAGGANIHAGSSVVVRNTIVADPLGGADNCGSGFVPGSTNFTSGGFNLDEDGSCGFEQGSDLVGVVAGLDPVLKDNGGATPTHALLAGSVAIDRGNSFGSGVDQRGLPRPSDFPAIGNKEGGDGADIGAFEVQAPAASGGAPVLVSEEPADRTPPNTRIVSGPARVTFKREAKFRFASTEGQSSFQCKLDRKRWRGCRNPFKRAVKPGKHLFKVRAIDRFGNVDPTPARFGWRVKPLGR